MCNQTKIGVKSPDALESCWRYTVEDEFVVCRMLHFYRLPKISSKYDYARPIVAW